MDSTPWQLDMFNRSIKKRKKVNALLKFVGQASDKRCLLLTCGDNTGAMNYYFIRQGGDWFHADLQDENLASMHELTQGRLVLMDERGPCYRTRFDIIIVLDVLEHIRTDVKFLDRLKSILKPDGRIIVTVPNAGAPLLANHIRNRMGMTPDKYGHVRGGYTVAELNDTLRQAGYQVLRDGGYSRIITELIELAINYVYVNIMNKGNSEHKEGVIAPTSQKDLKKHGLSYRLFSVLSPVLWAISQLDGLIFWGGRYATISEGSIQANKVA
jgi:SAM-dependent methyltransferase